MSWLIQCLIKLRVSIRGIRPELEAIDIGSVITSYDGSDSSLLSLERDRADVSALLSSWASVLDFVRPSLIPSSSKLFAQYNVIGGICFGELGYKQDKMRAS